MENEKLAQAANADPNAPATLTDEQAAQVAGGRLVVSVGVLGGGRGGMCCLTCASVGRPLFSTVASSMTI